jgi:hypothetical protein
MNDEQVFDHIQEASLRQRRTSFRGISTLKFLWKIVLGGTDREILFEFKPPYIPAKRRTWDREKGTYQTITVNLEAQSYRLLWHYLKNKLDAVQWGMETMEKEFLSHAVVSLPDGSTTTIGEKINQVYETVRQPALTQQYEQSSERTVIDIERSD